MDVLTFASSADIDVINSTKNTVSSAIAWQSNSQGNTVCVDVILGKRSKCHLSMR